MDLTNYNGERGLDCSSLGQLQVAGPLKVVDEPSASIKCGEYVEQLRSRQLVNKDSAPCS